jgi:hypothetical protein
MQSIATHVIVLQGLVDTTVKKVNTFSYIDFIVYFENHDFIKNHIFIEAIFVADVGWSRNSRITGVRYLST